VIDLKNLTAISQEGEDVPLELMSERVKFRCGVFTQHVLRHLARQSTQEPSRNSQMTLPEKIRLRKSIWRIAILLRNYGAGDGDRTRDVQRVGARRRRKRALTGKH
jgi:hypothetical protein